MRKVSKNSLTRLAFGVTAVALALGMTGCAEDPAGQTFNAVTGEFVTQYLRVNDTNVVCFTDGEGLSTEGTFCDFSEISIPNGVEVTVLTDDEPRQGDWELNYFVDLKNETSDCLTYDDQMVTCNFLSDAANGSYGTEK